jgi:hypothetical protein
MPEVWGQEGDDSAIGVRHGGWVCWKLGGTVGRIFGWRWRWMLRWWMRLPLVVRAVV